MSYVLGLLASAMSGPAETGDNLAQQFESLTSNICSAKVMSVLPPKADMCGAAMDVRYGPIADIS
jgi:hypothetical protein